MNKTTYISVDFQNDFTAIGGLHFNPRPSVGFIKKTLIPFFKEHNIKIAEIISDYRQPRPKRSKKNACCPGEWGYESEIPENIKLKNIWIKSMNSPIWVRENIGIAKKEAGIPYQDTKAFSTWLEKSIGKPEDIDEVVLIGLTLDCCVLSTAQELAWRGYTVSVLEEAVDTYSGDPEEKEWILRNVPLRNWARVISWEALEGKLRSM